MQGLNVGFRNRERVGVSHLTAAHALERPMDALIGRCDLIKSEGVKETINRSKKM